MTRGGKRAGAGRPYLELHQEAGRAISKTITLPAETWERLEAHCTGSLSDGVAALLKMATECHPNGTAFAGWTWVEKRDK